MSLSSPRFSSGIEFSNIQLNFSSLKNGKRGRAVQIVQQALIDLGFSVGASDGIFGTDTEKGVEQFQKWHRLKEDGEVGSETLTLLDGLLLGFQHKVRVHFRSINDTNVPFGRILSCTKTVYAQYGINVEMTSGKSLLLTPAQIEKFFSVNTECAWDINSGEAYELHSMGGGVPSNEILVYFINKFDDANLLGCGGHAKNRPAATVASRGSQWDTAHEICHVLLTSAFSPVHSDLTSNLMYAYSSSSNATPMLNNLQLAQIRRSVCCV